MRTDITALATLAAAGVASAHPNLASRQSGSSSGENPFEGRQLFVNPDYSESLEVTRESFQGNDTDNAGKVQFIQEQVGSFVWISNIAALDDIDTAIEAATTAQDSGEEQIVGLVLYNLPDRDCSAGESSGELTVADGGLERYKTEYVDVFAEKVLGSSGLQFAIVVEPDAVANMVTGGDIELCSNAAEPQRDGMAYAIQQLQAENVHVYLDAANGGWLGDEESITATASEFADIVGRTNGSGVRGFSTNVSNYNAFAAESPEPITDGSQSYDESHFVSNLAPAFEAESLPSRFIVDQGRVALPGARNDWGDWCNIEAGFGQPPTTKTDNEYVDSIVWVKPGGESDGECGMSGAPEAGSWFNAAAQLFTENAHPDIQPITS